MELFTTPGGRASPRNAWSYPDFVDLRAADTGVTMTAWINGEMKTRIQAPDGRETTAVETMFVSANYFTTVGAVLARGTGFDAAADDRGAACRDSGLPVLADRQFDSDPDIVGKTLTFDGIPHLVVGIAP